MRSPTLSANGLGAILALLAFAVFSTHDVIVKQLAGSYSPFQIIFFTSLISFPLISLVLMSDRRPDTLRPHHPYWIALRCLCGSVSGISAFYALGVLPLSQFYAFLFASPLIITLLAIPVLGETVRLRRGLAVFVGLIGVIIAIRPGSSELSLGHAAALIAACAGAMVSIITRKIGKDERTVVMIMFPMMTNVILTSMMLPWVYVPVPLEDLGWLAVDSGLVLIAMGALVVAYTRADAIVVAPMQYSQIIWAVLFGIVFFGDYPAWQTYLGTAVIALSGVYILKREATGAVSSTTPVLKTRTRMGHNLAIRVGVFLRRNREQR